MQRRWQELTCVMEEEYQRDDPRQNHVSGSYQKARAENIFEHGPNMLEPPPASVAGPHASDRTAA